MMFRRRCAQGDSLTARMLRLSFYVSASLLIPTPTAPSSQHTASTLPRLWLSRSYPSAKPLAPYIADFVQRLRMFQSWIDTGAPVVVWLPGFFFTQSFLTAVLQNFARKYRLPVDSLAFSYKILADVPSSKPENGCYIHGLYLDGGRWNAGHQCLADPQPKVFPFILSSPAVFAFHPFCSC